LFVSVNSKMKDGHRLVGQEKATQNTGGSRLIPAFSAMTALPALPPLPSRNGPGIDSMDRAEERD